MVSRRGIRALSLLALLGCTLTPLAVACSSSDTVAPPPAPDADQPEAAPTDPPPSTGSFNTDTPDAEEKDTNQPPAQCATTESKATSATRPVDIIITIDNSPSMGTAIDHVEHEINTHLAAALDQSGIDYHVVLISGHGAHGSVSSGLPDQRICVAAPLSGTNCNPIPAQPVDGPRFIHHSVAIPRTVAWCDILTYFDKPNGSIVPVADEFGRHPQGYSYFLRPEAFKIVIVISDGKVSIQNCNGKQYDDGSSVPGGTGVADQYDNALLQRSETQFGTKAVRNYVFHAIAGMTDYDMNNPAVLWPPSAPISTTKCSTPQDGGTVQAFDPGTGYQGLAIETGGLRFPVCAADYTPIFEAFAQSAIQGASVPCEYDIPDPPAGQTLDLEKVVPEYTPGGNGSGDAGAPVLLSKAADESSCGANQFYVTGVPTDGGTVDASAGDAGKNGKIVLCPTSCQTVQSDPAAKVTVLYGCTIDQIPDNPSNPTK